MKRLLLKISKKGLYLGPFLFLITLILPLNLTPEAHRFLAIFMWVISQWLFTYIPLHITGIFGVSLSIILGVDTASNAFAPFSNPIIFLFLGGFLMAKALENLRFDRKISLTILSLPWVGTNLKRTIFAIYALTAFFSMWVSNTATTAMMIPIVIGILKNLEIENKELRSHIILGTAYAATIGGLGTPIGSPPNMIALGFLNELAGIQFSFLSWFFMAIPLVVVLLFILFKYSTRHINDHENLSTIDHIEKVSQNFGPLNRHEISVMIVFGLAIFFWFSPSIITLLLGNDHAISVFAKARLNPGVVSIFFACLLFVLPFRDKNKILSGNDVKTIDWGSLLLFGSGLSLGNLLFKTGLASEFGTFLVGNFAGGSMTVFIIMTIFFTVFLTEVSSNTASANILIPIIIAASQQSNYSPLLPAIAVALSCNLAFMLPVATPPNAIAYGSGEIKLKKMVKVGFWMNAISIVVLSIIFSILL
ncbi:MAG: DASS family sodium-coupled anion symporter [Bacteriovoracaceae bacterium]|nr:DASS family sodium-coupled anion symporter [Bacteriovoracaceae bacterium]